MSEQTVEVWQGKVRIRVLSKGSGPALVFFHGPWGLQWDPFLDELARNFTVYAPEHPGTTAETPEDVHHLDGMWDLVLCYDELLEALGLNGVALVGHSFGGMMACEKTGRRAEFAESAGDEAQPGHSLAEACREAPIGRPELVAQKFGEGQVGGVVAGGKIPVLGERPHLFLDAVRVVERNLLRPVCEECRLPSLGGHLSADHLVPEYRRDLVRQEKWRRDLAVLLEPPGPQSVDRSTLVFGQE